MPIYITNFWTKLRNKVCYESYDLKCQTYPLNITIPNLGQFIPIRVLRYNYEYEQHKMMQYRLPHYEIPLQASVRTPLPLYIFLLMLQIWNMHVPRWPTIQRRCSNFSEPQEQLLNIRYAFSSLFENQSYLSVFSFSVFL